MENIYLKQKLDGSSGIFGSSFSNRYTTWRIKNSIIASLRGRLSEERSKSISILDVGCFEGSLLFEINSLFSDTFSISSTGIDLSTHGIEFASKRAEYFNLKGFTFAVMDANKLEYPDKTFDFVICTEVVEHIPNPENVFNEISRVLSKTGTAIITTPNGGNNLVKLFSKLFNFFSFGYLKRSMNNDNKAIEKVLSPADINAQRQENVGFGHISVKPLKGWLQIISNAKLSVQRVAGTGGPFFGSPIIDAIEYYSL